MAGKYDDLGAVSVPSQDGGFKDKFLSPDELARQNRLNSPEPKKTKDYSDLGAVAVKEDKPAKSSFQDLGAKSVDLGSPEDSKRRTLPTIGPAEKLPFTWKNVIRGVKDFITGSTDSKEIAEAQNIYTLFRKDAADSLDKPVKDLTQEDADGFSFFDFAHEVNQPLDESMKRSYMVDKLNQKQSRLYWDAALGKKDLAEVNLIDEGIEAEKQKNLDAFPEAKKYRQRNVFRHSLESAAGMVNYMLNSQARGLVGGAALGGGALLLTKNPALASKAAQAGMAAGAGVYTAEVEGGSIFRDLVKDKVTKDGETIKGVDPKIARVPAIIGGVINSAIEVGQQALIFKIPIMKGLSFAEKFDLINSNPLTKTLFGKFLTESLKDLPQEVGEEFTQSFTAESLKNAAYSLDSLMNKKAYAGTSAKEVLDQASKEAKEAAFGIAPLGLVGGASATVQEKMGGAKKKEPVASESNKNDNAPAAEEKPAQKEPDEKNSVASDSENVSQSEAEVAYGSEEEKDSALQSVSEKIKGLFSASLRRAGVVREFENNKKIDFTGIKVESPENFATLFQVFRSPSLEHFHIVALDANDVIVGHRAITSGSIDQVAFPDGWIENVRKWLGDLQSPKLVLMHNHPSGRVEASSEDRAITKQVSEAIPAFAYHVILNGGKFGQIGKDLSFSQGSYEQKSMDWLSDRGERFSDPESVANYFSDSLRGKNSVHVAFLDKANHMIAYEVLNPSDLNPEKIKNKIEKSKKIYGSSAYILVTDFDSYEDLSKNPDLSFVRGVSFIPAWPSGLLDVVGVKEAGGYRSANESGSIIKQNQPNVIRVLEPQEKYAKEEWFYSKLERLIDEKMPEQAPSSQVIGIIKSSGVSELNGRLEKIKKFLSAKSDYAKSEVLDFIREEKELGDWDTRFQEWIDGSLPSGSSISMGLSSDAIVAAGGDKLELVVNQSVLDKASKDKHGISPEDMRHLPKRISDPIMIFQSMKDANSMLVLTEILRGNDSVVAAIKLNHRVGTSRYEVNNITSIHAKDNPESFAQWADAGGLLYANRTKAKRWLRTQPALIAGSIHQRLADKNIPSEEDVVKRSQNLRIQNTSKEVPQEYGFDIDPEKHFEEIEAPEVNKERKEFKLFERAKEIIHKYADRVGERFVPRGAMGMFFPQTNNIRLMALNNLSTVTHEVTHYIDKATGFAEKVINSTGRGDHTRKELTRIYTDLYPGGKKSHKLITRIKEGYAVLIENFVQDPKHIIETYPDLVKDFINKDGMFFVPQTYELIKDVQSILEEYGNLKPIEQVAARVATSKQKVVKDSYLNFMEKVNTFIADSVYPIQKLAMMAGKQETKADPSLWTRLYKNVASLVMNNVKGSNGYWALRSGELKKLYEYNWKTLVEDLQKSSSMEFFGNWLIARRQYFAYKKLDELAASVKSLSEQANELQQMGDEEGLANLIEEGKKRVEQYKKLQEVLRNDNFDRSTIEKAYEEHKERFTEQEKMFDDLVRADLETMADPEVQLITQDQFSELSQEEGYATFRRDVYDEIIGQDGLTFKPRGPGGTKASSLIGRKGSELSILNPVYGSILNHSEMTRKALRQIVYNKMLPVAQQIPDLFQRVPLKAFVNDDGSIEYPQEYSTKESIIMARENYKRVPIQVDAGVKTIIDDLLSYKNADAFASAMMVANRIFVKGTTGSYPPFAVANFVVDQISALAQTRNNYIPVYDSLKTLMAAMSSDDSKESQYFQEYMALGGERQTMAGWQDLQPNELFARINEEVKGLESIKTKIDKGFDILAFIPKYSEIATRASEFINARKSGKDQILALEEASRVTAPFHHMGAWGGSGFMQAIIKSIPFSNASIQVLAEYGSALKNPERRHRAALVFAGVSMTMLASAAAIMRFGDDDDKEQYKNLEPKELAKYIYFPNPMGKGLIRFRIPDQMGTFGAMANMVLSNIFLKSKYKPDDFGDAFLSWVPDQFNPLEPERALVAWIPQFFKPALEILMGKKTYPKVRPLESPWLEYKEPRARYYENTSEMAKWIGDKLNLSPIKIDHLVEGYLGRTVKFFTWKEGLNPIQSMGKAFGDQFVREMYFTQGKNIQDYYDIRNENRQQWEALKNKSRDFTKEETQKIMWNRAMINNFEGMPGIDTLMGYYRDLPKDEIKSGSERSKKLRSLILNKIARLR